MAKIEIKKKDGVDKAFTTRDLTFKLDGQEIKELISLDLNLNIGELNCCSIHIAVDDLDVDLDALAEIKAHLQNKKGDG